MNVRFLVRILAMACLTFVHYMAEETTLGSPVVPQSCIVSEDCKPNECCVQHFAGPDKICRGIGKKAGDPCGGNFFCGDCDGHLECKPSVQPHEDHEFFGLFGECTMPERKKTCRKALTLLEHNTNANLSAS